MARCWERVVASGFCAIGAGGAKSLHNCYLQRQIASAARKVEASGKLSVHKGKQTTPGA
jgi:hypothetical protein